MTETSNRSLVYDVEAPRRPVNLRLNADLLSRVEMFTTDLSTTVEDLLERYLTAATRHRQADHERLDDVITALNVIHQQSGFLSDEFSTL